MTPTSSRIILSITTYLPRSVRDFKSRPRKSCALEALVAHSARRCRRGTPRTVQSAARLCFCFVSRDSQLVIFDCDGVLVDSEVISNRVLAEMLSTEGLPTTLTQARRGYQGLLLADVLSRAQEKLGRTLPRDWLARYETERAAAFHRELEPVAGAAETVKRITAAGIAVCVASQGKLAKTRLSLTLTGLDHLFPETVRFSAYSVAHGKPAPDLFLHAARDDGSRTLKLRCSGGHRVRDRGCRVRRDARSRLRGRQQRARAAPCWRNGDSVLAR